MRTRNAGTPKTPASQKKTPTSKKAASKTPTSATTPPPESTTPISAVTPATEPQATPSSEPQATPSSEPVPEPAVEQEKASTGDAVGSPPMKGTKTVKKVTKRIVKRKVVKPKTKAAEKAVETEDIKDDQNQKVDDTGNAKDGESSKAEEVLINHTESEAKEEVGTEKVEDVVDIQDKGKAKMDVDESPTVNAEETVDAAANSMEEPSEPNEVKEEVKVEEPVDEKTDELQDKQVCMEEDQNQEIGNDDKKPENTDEEQLEKAEEQGAQLNEEDAPVSEGIDDYGDEERFIEPGEEDLQEDDEPEMADETKALDEEQKELAAAAKERKIKKELEIFVGGLDREVVEDDVKKTFEKVGEIVEVRLLKDPVTNKNRGFAFVRFSTKEQAKRALSEMKNPVIRGKRCGTAPNEDNDTLFIGNICNTWTKEAIKQKLKEFNVDGVEGITLVQDPRHEGLSRGFCFIQFSCHADAMFAYKRLQKPDAVFGHAERTVKVAFAEPLQEPDPDVMAKVKSVFVDGLPPFWDEDRVRKHFKDYGEIERITLARNMSSAKRKDFGFVDYTTHEAAIACIEDVNRKELADGDSKIKVRARLSNPLPKTQAVKGGMCGGFRIGRPNGRSLGRTGPALNRPNFGYGRVARGPFNDPVGPPYVGRRFPYRGGHGMPAATPTGRPNFGGPRHGLVDRGLARPIPPRREHYPLDDGGYSRAYMGRHYEDSYMYDDSPSLKRPYYMTEPDHAYIEPSRARPRFDYTSAGRGTHFRDTFAAGTNMYSTGYYGPDYGARPQSSFTARDRTYGSGSGTYGSGSGTYGSGSGSSGSGSGHYY